MAAACPVLQVVVVFVSPVSYVQVYLSTCLTHLKKMTVIHTHKMGDSHKGSVPCICSIGFTAIFKRSWVTSTRNGLKIRSSHRAKKSSSGAQQHKRNDRVGDAYISGVAGNGDVFAYFLPKIEYI